MGHLSSSYVSFLIYAPSTVQKTAFFALFCKKSKYMKGIYTYASESSYYTLSEYDMVYKSLRHRSWDNSS